MISSTANVFISKTDSLPICLPIISLKRFRLPEKQQDPTQWNMFWVTPNVAVAWVPDVTCQLSRSMRTARAMGQNPAPGQTPQPQVAECEQNLSSDTYKSAAKCPVQRNTLKTDRVYLLLKIYPPTIRDC